MRTILELRISAHNTTKLSKFSVRRSVDSAGSSYLIFSNSENPTEISGIIRSVTISAFLESKVTREKVAEKVVMAVLDDLEYDSFNWEVTSNKISSTRLVEHKLFSSNKVNFYNFVLEVVTDLKSFYSRIESKKGVED